MLDAGARYETWEENEKDNKSGQRKIHCARKFVLGCFCYDNRLEAHRLTFF